MKKLLILVVVLCFGCNSGSNTQEESQSVSTPKDVVASVMPSATVKALMEAALAGNIEALKVFKGNGVNLAVTTPDGKTTLMLAAFNGHSEVVKFLIDDGVNVGAKDETGRTALMFASTGTDTKTVEMLLRNGAKVNEADGGEHFTPLMWAAAEGQTAICKVLLANGADPAMKDVDGDTASSFAGKNGHTELSDLVKPEVK
jgi:ankyrin repeat protein